MTTTYFSMWLFYFTGWLFSSGLAQLVTARLSQVFDQLVSFRWLADLRKTHADGHWLEYLSVSSEDPTSCRLV